MNRRGENHHVQRCFDVTMATIEVNVLDGPVKLTETSNILINGKGAGVANGVSCNSSLSVIDVEPGKTYRLQFIGGTTLTVSSFAIEDHDVLTVIEADGYIALYLYALTKSLADDFQIVHQAYEGQLYAGGGGSDIQCAPTD